MFEGQIPAKYKDRAPRVITKDDGSDAWVFEGEFEPVSVMSLSSNLSPST
jgi:hypothetical protein